MINAVSLKHTLDAFRRVLPLLPQDCILSDIASVKTGLKDFYEASGRRYVSTHPMFGPTFANLGALHDENAVIITEGDYMGRIFFRAPTVWNSCCPSPSVPKWAYWRRAASWEAKSTPTTSPPITSAIPSPRSTRASCGNAK